MACPGSNDPNDRNNLPKTPMMVLKVEETTPEPLRPDTVENVVRQTDGIFRNFVHWMYTLYRTREGQDADDTPSLPEITAFVDNPVAPATQVGRQLAEIGDEIYTRYVPQFRAMVHSLNLPVDASSETAYEAFAGVARRLFREGGIHWGRIITLLCFGYRLAITYLRRGVYGFFSNIITWIVKFVVSERIAQWIADQGGWVAALRYVSPSLDWRSFALVFGLAAASVLAALYLSRK